MSDQTSNAPHEPGVYVKGERTRVAASNAEAVALTFDGYVRKGDEPEAEAPKVDYHDLQKQAKELDIPANQTADELQKQIDAALSDQS